MMINFTFCSTILTVLIASVAPNVFYVTTNSSGNGNGNTLKHYLDNSKKYFTSDSKLIFFPGEHQLDVDLVIEGIRNFTITGINPCKIYCSSNTSILAVNVTQLEFQNISLINCGKNHTAFIYQGNSTGINNYKPFKKKNDAHYNYNSSILFYHCAVIRIFNVNISVSVYFGGIIAMNVNKSFIIYSVKVQLECSDGRNFEYPTHASGILLQYKNTKGNNVKVKIYKFNYKVIGTCVFSSRYAIRVVSIQNKYNILITIQDTKFYNFNHSGALYYSMKSCKLSAVNSIYINNSVISNNIGDSTQKMFYIQLYKPTCAKKIYFKDGKTKQHSCLHFINCKFVNNTNMHTMIYIMPASTSAYAGKIRIEGSHFIKNNNTRFIEVKGETEIVPWQLSAYIYLDNTNVSMNEHHDSSDLISITNSVLYLNNSTFMHNGYYENILKLHLSMVLCSGYNLVANNSVRHVMKATSGSYFLMNRTSALSIIDNTVYNIVRQVDTYGDTSRIVCPIQFYSPEYNYDYHPGEIDVQVFVLYNVHTMSKGLIGSDLTFSNCTWLAGSSFRIIDAEVVYKKVFQIDNIVVTRNSTRRIPLSICPCSNSNSNCYLSILPSIYPGQTLYVSLSVRKEYLSKQNSVTLVVANTPEDDCIITESYQLSQTHFSHGCNNYSYTIWPSHKDITQCKLFVGLMKMPELFFVEIKLCPRGFTLQPNIKTCDCDPALNNIYFTVTSCDLDDQTIARPANSWISCDSSNGSYTYVISPHCPFDYCAPYSSNLLLTTPDMQCQYERSGTLCGHCKDGLSTVFGSSHCKQCSSLYLFIVVPIAIAGVFHCSGTFCFQHNR